MKKGDRVVLPFNISCSQCDNSNSNPEVDIDIQGDKLNFLHAPYGSFMPFVKLENEKLLFLSDVLPAAYWSVDNSVMKQGDTVVVLRCGPVGLMAQKFSSMRAQKGLLPLIIFLTACIMQKNE